MSFEFPLCQSKTCKGSGIKMIPLSDYGPDGASVIFKAWACQECRAVIRIDKGDVTEHTIGKYKNHFDK